MRERLGFILSRLYRRTGALPPLSGIDADAQFRPEERDAEAAGRNLNAAFLIRLCGRQGEPQRSRARAWFAQLAGDPRWAPVADFYEKALKRLPLELDDAIRRSGGGFGEEIARLNGLAANAGEAFSGLDALEACWRVFFPEGVESLKDAARAVEDLRGVRTIALTGLNERPIERPVSEVLFASNVLLTRPSGEPHCSARIRERLAELRDEPQLFWYDHPMPIGVDPEQSEVIYGLRALDQAVAFEKGQGVASPDERLSCVLSVSVTHEGLASLAREVLEESLREGLDGLPHLRVYALTEADAERLFAAVLAPAAERYRGGADLDALRAVYGVNGEYGRHYTFLRALAAFWHVLIDRRVRATFKIDLDQVFPQEQLLRETGCSAFAHLKTPLWGAAGIDARGEKVRLGLIAGALVNAEDAHRSLFEPDVPMPETSALRGDEWIFCSALPQAVSTRAEMLARYDREDLDGRRTCIQRIHVTGGTCGAWIEDLRRHRPFTPTFIGRAEDQAYLLSCLFASGGEFLRYVHKPGLIMRHDKAVFAAEAVRAAAAGKQVGDYIRMLLFTEYARALPWPVEETKGVVDPFTGCFISRIPVTAAVLRLALKAARMFTEGDARTACELLEGGAARLARWMGDPPGGGRNFLAERVATERRAWNDYYDLLDALEKALEQGDPFAHRLEAEARRIMEGCELRA
ncbi:hypothetical protein [Desulfatiglans anilini]|uniref:hypothetical protein n=1 Tax=Desulfatiglans anilini TaxID=90728 RepID=UPI0003FF124F|nr:hypothetical protein [Desulfatiglans anilini]